MNASLLATDLNYDTVKNVHHAHPLVTVVRPEEITSMECDVLCRCAVSGVLISEVIPKLRCRIVAGATTGVLKTESEDDCSR